MKTLLLAILVAWLPLASAQTWPSKPMRIVARGLQPAQMLVAPARTATAIIERMQREVANGLRNEEVKTRLTELGATPVGSSAKEAEAFLKAELACWADVAKRAGIKPQD